LNIFDIINDVAFTKRARSNFNLEEEKNIQPFLLNRWLSMLDSSAALIINETLNKYGQCFNNFDNYKFLLNVLPKYKFKRIEYIKKPKVQDS
jgi:hypothetical protein